MVSTSRNRRRLALAAGLCVLIAATFAVTGPSPRAQSGTVIVIHTAGGNKTVSDQQIRDNADVPAQDYRVRNSHGEADPQPVPQALSLSKLLSIAGVDDAKFIELPRAHSGDFLLEPSNYRGVDGQIVFWIDGPSVHWFRPLLTENDTNASDNYATQAGSSELDLVAHTGHILDVSTSVSPGGANAGDRLFFTAQADDKVAGEVLTYKWDFGDGTTGVGKTPTHVYKTAGAWTAAVTVTGDKDSKGSDTVDVTVGKAPKPPTNDSGGNSGDRNEQQNNNSSGGNSHSGSNSGGSSGGSSSGGTSSGGSSSGGTSSGGTSTPAPFTPSQSPSPSPQPTPTKKNHEPRLIEHPPIPTDVSGLAPVSGVLISDVHAPALAQTPLAILRTAKRAKAAAIPSTPAGSGSLPFGIAAAALLFGLGALRERRR